MTPNSQGYQPSMSGPEMMGRMGPYESNKDPFGGMRKGEQLPYLMLMGFLLVTTKTKLLFFQFKPENSSCNQAPTVGWESNTTEAHLARWATCRWARGNSTRTDMTEGKHTAVCYYLNVSVVCYVAQSHHNF